MPRRIFASETGSGASRPSVERTIHTRASASLSAMVPPLPVVRVRGDSAKVALGPKAAVPSSRGRETSRDCSLSKRGVPHDRPPEKCAYSRWRAPSQRREDTQHASRSRHVLVANVAIVTVWIPLEDAVRQKKKEAQRRRNRERYESQDRATSGAMSSHRWRSAIQKHRDFAM
jgi:hypothetical protein